MIAAQDLMNANSAIDTARALASRAGRQYTEKSRRPYVRDAAEATLQASRIIQAVARAAGARTGDAYIAEKQATYVYANIGDSIAADTDTERHIAPLRMAIDALQHISDALTEYLSEDAPSVTAEAWQEYETRMNEMEMWGTNTRSAYR